jgi:hypothetical protein
MRKSKTPTPRASNFMGMHEKAMVMPDGTWLEPEAMCYPDGGMTRRAYALFPDGKKRIVVCGIPDTYFSIPARPVKVAGIQVRGYIGSDESGIKFVPFTTQNT